MARGKAGSSFSFSLFFKFLEVKNKHKENTILPYYHSPWTLLGHFFFFFFPQVLSHFTTQTSPLALKECYLLPTNIQPYHYPLSHITLPSTMDTYTTPYYPTPLPIPAAKPSAYGPPYNPGYYPSGADSTYSVSPPEDIEVSSSSAGGPPSYSVGPSAGGSSRLGSECSEMGGYYDGVSGGAPGSSVGSASGVDLNEYMQERFAAAFEPARVAMDQCVLRQAQT